MKNKNMTWAVLAFLIVLIVLIGCARSNEAEQQNLNSDASIIELKVSGFKSGSELGAIPALNEKFMRENPGIKVVYTGMPGRQYLDYIKIRFATNSAHDVVMMYPGMSHMQAYGDSNYLLDLANEPWIANFLPSSLQALSSGNKIYGIPNDRNLIGVYYNTSIFSELSLQVPTDWESFMAVNAVIKATGLLPISIGNNDAWMTLAGLIAMAPAAVFEENPDFISQLNNGTATFSGAWETMLEDWFSLNDRGYFTPNSTEVSLEQAQLAFANGEAAMFIDGTWSMASIQKSNPNLKFSMFTMPANKKGHPLITATTVGTAWSINKNSPHIEAAKKYLAFWSQEETQREWAKSHNSFMTLKDKVSDVSPELHEIGEALKHGKTYTFFDQELLYGPVLLQESALGVYLDALSPEQMLMNMDLAWKDAEKAAKADQP